MAKNYVQPGKQLTLTAPSGGVKGGQLVKVGDLVGVSQFDADAGQDFVMAVCGVYKDLPKRSHASEEAIAVGDSLYLDADGGASSTPALSKVSTSNGNVVAVAVESAATTDSTVTVLLRGIAV